MGRRRVGYWFSLGTLALLALALTWLWTADLGIFKPQVERFLSEEIGREFTIGGDLSVDLAAQTTIVAEDVRIANAAWADGADMVTVGRAEIRIDLWSLVSGPVVIELLDLDDTAIALVNRGDADPNWVLPIAAEADAARGGDRAGAAVLLRHIDIDRLNVRLESVHRERPVALVLERLDQRHRGDDFLDLEARGALDGRRIEVQGEVGSWENLLAGRNIEFELDVVLGTLALSGRGRIDDIANLRRPEIHFTARGPDIDDLTGMLALGDEGEGDIELTASLVPQPEGPLALELKGHLGLTEIDARGAVADLQTFDEIELSATSSGPDLGRILRLAGIHQVREAPFSVQVDVETRGGTFIVNDAHLVLAGAEFDGTARLPNFPGIDDAVVRLEVEGPDIERFRYITGMPGAATGPFAAAFTIDVREDGFEVLEMKVQTSLGELRAGGKVANAKTFVGSQVDFRLQGDSLARVARAYRLEALPDKPFELTGAVEYTPAGIRTRGPLKARVDGVSAEVDGLVALTAGIRGSDLRLTVQGPSLAALVGRLADTTAVPPLPFDAHGRLQVDGDGFRFRGVRASLGSSTIRADGLLVAAPGIAGSRLDFEMAGPAFEEIVEPLGALDVRPGAYELSGRIAFHPEVIDLSNLRLDREAGVVRLNLGLGMPISKQWLSFDLRANGRDIRSVVHGIEGFQLHQQPFSLEVKGNLRGQRLSVDQLVVEVGTATIDAVGDLDLTDAAGAREFTLALNVPNIARVGTIGNRGLREQAFSIDAHAISSRGVLEADKLELRIGDSVIRGRAELRNAEVPRLDLVLRSDSLVLIPLLEPREAEHEAEPQFTDGRVIPDVRLPFDAMRKLDASVDVEIGELQRESLRVRDVALEAHLENGVLEVPRAGFTGRSGRIRGKARIDPADGAGTTSLQLVAKDFALGISESGRDGAMTADLELDLRGTGSDLRAVLGNLNGIVFLDIRGGRISRNSRFVQVLYGDLLEEILNTINPFREEDPYTAIECAIVSARIEDGVWTGAPTSLVSTEKIRIVTRSSIDFGNEELRIGIRTTPKRILSISAAELVNPYVQVVGTLARPRLAVDEKGVLITGGAAVATGGVSLLARGLYDRLSRSGDACGKASEAAISELGDRFPDLAIEAERRE